MIDRGRRAKRGAELRRQPPFG